MVPFSACLPLCSQAKEEEKGVEKVFGYNKIDGSVIHISFVLISQFSLSIHNPRMQPHSPGRQGRQRREAQDAHRLLCQVRKQKREGGKKGRKKDGVIQLHLDLHWPHKNTTREATT